MTGFFVERGKGPVGGSVLRTYDLNFKNLKSFFLIYYGKRLSPVTYFQETALVFFCAKCCLSVLGADLLWWEGISVLLCVSIRKAIINSRLSENTPPPEAMNPVQLYG